MKRKTKKLVGIIMGSDSDPSVMREAATFLDSFGVSNEIRICTQNN
jgi:phosphoribosylcarboxyaminoimidazole (NCAIR) mutase